MDIQLSFLIPVYCSREILPKLTKSIHELSLKLNLQSELVLIDDASKDGSFEKIKELTQNYPFIRAFRLNRNFGQQNALFFGLAQCRGQRVAILDDDMQDPPEIIEDFMKEMDKGFDVVFGVRKKRKESFFKVIAYHCFYRVLRIVSEIEIPVDTGDFCLMSKGHVDKMLLFQERSPFLRGLRSWVGGKQVGYEYERPSRDSGESHYSFSKLLKIALDGLFNFSYLPLRLITLFGLVSICVAILFSLYTLGKYVLFGIQVEGFTSTILLVLFFGSMNTLFLGIIGEYIGRHYIEQKKRPHVIIAEKIGE